MKRLGAIVAVACVTLAGLLVTTDVPVGAAVATERLAGADRLATAIAVSQRGWPEGSRAAVLASGADHRDALAAAGVAGRLGSVPVLLTAPDALRDDVAAELARLRPREIVLIGGADAIGPAVESAVRAIAGSVRRVAGADAAATAATAATEGGALPASARGRVFLVHAGDADSGVLAGALAAARGAPVLLVTSGDAVPDSTRTALTTLAPTETIVVGSPAIITDALVASVPAGRRIAGTDPYDVSVQLAELGADWGLTKAHVVIAHGWVDSVPAAVLAARFGAPLLLTDTHLWHGQLASWFAAAPLIGATIVGGENAVDPFVAGTIVEGGPSLVRRRGDVGPVVSALQQRLLDTGFNPGPVTGVFNEHTQFAMWALQKAFDLPINGVMGAAELRHLQARHRPPVLRPDITERFGDHVEISLRKQLMQVVKNGEVVVAVHTSTGKASTPTIRGVFRILDHRPGTNALGMYKTMHFFRGFAIHGYPSVPLFPASHGCARLNNRDADLLFEIVPNGMTVVTWL